MTSQNTTFYKLLTANKTTDDSFQYKEGLNENPNRISIYSFKKVSEWIGGDDIFIATITIPDDSIVTYSKDLYIVNKINISTIIPSIDFIEQNIDNCDIDELTGFLYNVGRYGTINLIDKMIEKGADEFNNCMMGACEGGRFDVVQHLCQKEKYDWSIVLPFACSGGNKEVIDFIIQKGADINEGLSSSCFIEKKEIVQYLIEKGATNCTYCFNTKHTYK